MMQGSPAEQPGNWISYAFALLGLVLLLLATGFFFQHPWAVALWPWPESRLSYIFIAAIAAANSAALLWIARSKEFGAAVSGGLFLGTVAAGMAAVLFRLYAASGQTIYLIDAGAGIAFALFTLAVVLWSRRFPLRDARALPGFARCSFGLFALILVLAGGALLAHLPVIFPWPLKPETAEMFGWIFLGAAWNYLYAFIVPRWHYAAGPLLGFLAYDLVLIVPFLNHLSAVRPDLLTSLILYIAVLLYSGAVAVYYLLFSRATRAG